MSTQLQSNAPISRSVALRIALAARSLPDTEPKGLLRVLADAIGLPPTPNKLASLTVKILKSAANAELASIDTGAIKEALAYLNGDKSVGENDELPVIEQFQEGDGENSIRIACASNTGEDLDGHFGSCARFLIYQLSASTVKLIDVRTGSGLHAGDDKNEFRANLLRDCQVLFVASIGGPAAAKVVRVGVHPIKYLKGGSARQPISDLQKAIASTPPPWLAKVMGHDDDSRVRFERSAVEA
ncbi:hypothetical protein MNBD_GAMMA25-1757 [hydrothermal vent metagenome]|uniref:Dinitrogenase iron-molybdenum cofactor biosynthesis protein n=1 Tax=hydrothermal vent metagenome TaxID=652676 RepID=A0A3B1BHS4_9ZZZZ